ncbi:Methylisocitrate lyase [hydrothermal vent metagenome]|uniref:Methylisocitrate lyase n=1 Tax=hydrothermal vent metagenome TaxID=652676 RepID=A0A3B1D9H6_9ZZZZ
MMGDSPGRQLRKLLKKKPILLPGAYNALSAQLIEAAGLQALYISGAGLANGVAGLPDIGLLSLTEVTAQVSYITGAVKIPAIADADTGYGEGLHFCRAVAAFEAAGVAGIQIEDQVFPKRCGHLLGKSLISAKAMSAKVAAAVETRSDSNFMIIARTDARGVSHFQDAVDRAKSYVDAGADMIFPEALQSAKEFEDFAKLIDVPLLANMTEFGVSPALSAEVLFEMGYRIVLFPMSLFRIAAKAMCKALIQIKKEGSTLNLLDQMQSRKDLYELLDYDVFERRDREMGEE